MDFARGHGLCLVALCTVLSLLGLVVPEATAQSCSAGDTAVTGVYGVTNRDALAEDCATLLDLRDEIQGTGSLNWVNTLPMHEWTGILVAGNRVTALSPLSNDLTGTIPAALSNLPSLVYLSFWNTQVSGNLSALSNLTSLQELHLNETQVSGNLSALSNLTSLQELHLNKTQVSGNLSALSNLTSLQLLDLWDTQVGGDLSALSNLTSLLALDLCDTQVSGNLSALSNLTRLGILHLCDTQVSGNLSALSNLTRLGILHLCDTQVSGNLSALSNLTSLQELELDNTQVSGNLSVLSNLTSLIRLSLWNSQVSGNLSALSNLTRLEILDLSYTQISGNLSALSNLTRLEILDLSYTQISGDLSALSNLAGLLSLQLCDTQVSGDLSALSSLTRLIVLSLYGTNLATDAELPPALETRRTNNQLTVYPCPRVADDVILENPPAGSFQSGIGLVSGWACNAERVEVELLPETGASQRVEAAYGTERLDTEAECGDTNNGFGLLYNWNRLGDGDHEVVVRVDGTVIDRQAITVTTLGGEEFRRGLERTEVIEGFPSAGESVMVRWQEAQQNFVIIRGEAPDGTQDTGNSSPDYVVENPPAGSFQSGIGLVSGWACNAEMVEVEFIPEAGGPASWRTPVAYGTERLDTEGMCGDTNNGFGLLHNWNRLEDGTHQVVVWIDGEVVGRRTIIVTTLGEEFPLGLSGTYVIEDFPAVGETVTLEWQEAKQNFVITNWTGAEK